MPSFRVENREPLNSIVILSSINPIRGPRGRGLGRGEGREGSGGTYSRRGHCSLNASEVYSIKCVD